MFPNPQDALPKPPNPNVQQYRKLAKDLAKVCRTGSSDGIRDWTSGFVQHLVQLSRLEDHRTSLWRFHGGLIR